MNRWQRRFLGSTSLPSDLSDFELEYFFKLSAQESAAVQTRYKSNHRIAVGIQLGFLKLAGRPLAAVKVLPVKLLHHMGAQLDVPAPSIASLRALYKRRATLYAHQSWALNQSGIAGFSGRERINLQGFLNSEASAAPTIDSLIQSAREWLYERRILIPAQSTLRELAVSAYAQMDRGNFELICAEIPSAVRDNWRVEVFKRREGESRSFLQWLQEPPRKFSPATIVREFEKLDFLISLEVDRYVLEQIPIEKQRAYAHRLRNQRPARFNQAVEPRRTLDLVCFLSVALLDITDAIIQLTGRRTLSFVRKARKRAQKLELQQLESYKSVVNKVELILADDTCTDAVARGEALSMIRRVNQTSFHTKAAATRHALSDNNPRIRATLARLTTLDIQGSADNATIKAIDAIREFYANKTKKLPRECEVSYPRPWRDLVEGEDRERALHAFEASTLLDIRRGLKRGALWLNHSAAYRNPDKLLIGKDKWAKARLHHFAGLQLSFEPEPYLDKLQAMLDAGLAALSEAVTAERVKVEAGLIHITQLKAEPIPTNVTRQKAELIKAIGSVQLPEMMLEIDSLTRFSWHLLGRGPKSADELVALYLGLIAHGTPLEAAGVAKMTKGIGVDRILSAMAQLEANGVLTSANEAVVSFLREQPVTNVWGDGRVAASDMMSLEASKHLWTARVDPKRRTFALGVYNHVLDQWGLVYDQPIMLGERQAGAAIEGAIRQRAPRIEKVAVDTHGYTNSALAVARLLRLDLLPRLRYLRERKLYVPRRTHVPENLKDVVDKSVSERAIRVQWEELARLAASIEAGVVTADVALARFASAATSGDPLHRAAEHLGRMLRTIFLCDYLTNEAFRREVHRLIDHGESVHTLQRAIYFGRIPVQRARRQEEAVAISGSLTLLTNIAIAWTTYKIQIYLNQSRSSENSVFALDWLRHVSPARSEHINFRGTFHFPISLYLERLLANPTRRARSTAQ